MCRTNSPVPSRNKSQGKKRGNGRIYRLKETYQPNALYGLCDPDLKKQLFFKMMTKAKLWRQVKISVVSRSCRGDEWVEQTDLRGFLGQ